MGDMKQSAAKLTLLLGTVVIAFFVMVSLIPVVKAESAAGTWTGTCSDETGAAIFYYSATLELNGAGTFSGTLRLTCTDVDVKISGFEDARAMIGTTTSSEVGGTMTDGSHLTLNRYTGSDTYTFSMIVSGGGMTGGGSYAGAASETNTWSFDLSHTGGGSSLGDFSFSFSAAAIGGIGAVAGLVTSFLPAPNGTGNVRAFRGRTRHPAPSRTQRTPAKQIPRPYKTSPVPPPSRAPSRQPTPDRRAPPPALANPVQSLGLPLQQNPTEGNTLVPWDAPMQCLPTQDPPGYPFPKGTNASMRCPYCGSETLSPFTTGWFCTNALCPARRESLQHGYTHDQFNNMTWRGM